MSTSLARFTAVSLFFLASSATWWLFSVAQAQPEKTEGPPLAARAQEILRKHCFECHGKDLNKPKGKLRLFDAQAKVNVQALLEDTERKIIVAKAPSLSEMIKKIEEEDEEGRMPPKAKGRVPAAEVKILRDWIAGIQPIKPEPPLVVKAPLDLANTVKGIFKTHCSDCHGKGKGTEGGLDDVLNRDTLVEKDKLIVPGKPDASTLYQRLVAREMPKAPRNPLDQRDIDAVRAWIQAGAPAFPAEKVPPRVFDRKEVVGDEYILKQILAHVGTLNPDDIQHVRYFSTNHFLVLDNEEDDLLKDQNLQREALITAINHLSSREKLVAPQGIDKISLTAANQPVSTVFAVNIRDLGWHNSAFELTQAQKTALGVEDINLFDLVLLEYPYGMVYQDNNDYARIRTVFLQSAGQVLPVPYVRADWFVSTATQPPLYHDLLQLPNTLKDLEEKFLRVDTKKNIANRDAFRAGMIDSGVSKNNRVVERHTLEGRGYYWKSYDFGASKGQKNILVNPVDFKEDGGEMIFSLPNGLQAYYIANAAGNRIDVAPTDIVVDKFAADKAVRTGLACMRCHAKGMINFTDIVRPAAEKMGDNALRRQILDLYPGQSTMKAHLEKDAKRFADAFQQLLGKLPGEESPLTRVAERFLDRSLPVTVASAELGLRRPNELLPFLSLQEFRDIGIAAFERGNVKRETWEDSFDQICRKLERGTPIVPIDSLSRRDYQTKANQLIDVELSTTKKNNTFEVGDKFAILVKNKSKIDIHIEITGSGVKGAKSNLTKKVTLVKAGADFRFPATGEIVIRAGLGKEQITLLASDKEFPAGELLKGKDGVVDRFVHPFYKLEGNGKRVVPKFDPATIVRKTLEIETR